MFHPYSILLQHLVFFSDPINSFSWHLFWYLLSCGNAQDVKSDFLRRFGSLDKTMRTLYLATRRSCCPRSIRFRSTSPSKPLPKKELTKRTLLQKQETVWNSDVHITETKMQVCSPGDHWRFWLGRCLGFGRQGGARSERHRQQRVIRHMTYDFRIDYIRFDVVLSVVWCFFCWHSYV